MTFTLPHDILGDSALADGHPIAVAHVHPSGGPVLTFLLGQRPRHSPTQLSVWVRNAQGDMATLSTMIDAAVSDQTDLLLVSTTPALQAALRRAGKHNVVFSLVANPVIAGAGKSNKDHAPNVTGA